MPGRGCNPGKSRAPLPSWSCWDKGGTGEVGTGSWKTEIFPQKNGSFPSENEDFPQKTGVSPQKTRFAIRKWGHSLRKQRVSLREPSENRFFSQKRESFSQKTLRKQRFYLRKQMENSEQILPRAASLDSPPLPPSVQQVIENHILKLFQNKKKKK